MGGRGDQIMIFKKNIEIFIKNNNVLNGHISQSEFENIQKLKEFSFYDLVDGEYLVNILMLRKKNFDENNVEYFHLSECIENLKVIQERNIKWLPIKFEKFYVIFIVDEMQSVLDFFAFKTKH